MSYNTSTFLIFIIIYFAIYFVLRGQRTKRNLILLANLIFYTYAGFAAAGIVLITACVAYWSTLRIEAVYKDFETEKIGHSPREQTAILAGYKHKAKKYLWASFVIILGTWIAVKIERFVGFSSVKTLTEVLNGKGIIVPLGISYYTLSVVGYILDVYWRKAKAEHDFFKLCTAITYFPHIVQGPISKYSSMLKQLDELPAFDYDRVCFGFQLMLWGYIKKMVIADRLALYTGSVFSAPGNFAGIEVFIAVILSVMQLYTDFSGCMDIVGGISQAIGIRLDANFKQPLFAQSIQEFWAKWHMTLGAWTKEYIYLPIAMNPRFVKKTQQLKKAGHPRRASFAKAFCPLIAVWLFTGLWHGTGIDYLVWGLYYCAIMTISNESKEFREKLFQRFQLRGATESHRILRAIRTYLIFAAGRMFTVTGSLAGCAILWKQLLKEHRLWTLFDGSLYTHGLDQKNFYVALAGIVAVLIVDFLHEYGYSIRSLIARNFIVIRWFIYYFAIFSLIIFGMYGPGYDAASFVYGAF